MISIVYSADYSFQVIKVLPFFDSTKSWEVANKDFKEGKYKANNIEHYDVVTFKEPNEMNEWILEQVKLSRD